MIGNRIEWATPALLTAAATAVACVVTALFAREGQLFAAALAAGTGIAATTAHTVLAMRAADRRMAKLSDELTVQSRRLVRLESRREPTGAEASAATNDSHGQDVAALMQATGALAEVLDGQDARLRALEQRDASVVANPPPAAPLPTTGLALPLAPPMTPPLAPPLAPAPAKPDRQGLEDLNTREDFARAARMILGRLASDPLRVIEAPGDDAIVADLEAGRLELWLLPVVRIPQRQVRFYLAQPHLRGADGEVLGPESIRAVLGRRRKLDRFDAFALSHALLVAGRLAEHGRETTISLPLSRDSLGNAAFVDGAAERLAEDRAAAARLMLSVEMADAQTLSVQESAALDRLRACGASLALSGVPDLDQDWAALTRRGFGHAVIEIDAILGPRPHATTEFLVASAARAGMSLVASGVGSEQQVPDLLDFDVPLACGPALAAARPVKSGAVAPPAPMPAAAPPVEERTSFRDFLRRAG